MMDAYDKRLCALFDKPGLSPKNPVYRPINPVYRLKLQLSIDNEVLVKKPGLSNKAHIRA